jgi:hypothetical protein
VFPNVIFGEGPLVFCLGGSLLGQKEGPIVRPQLGPFGVFPVFKDVEVQRLHELGPRAFPNQETLPHYLYAMPEFVDGFLSLNVRAEVGFGANMTSSRVMQTLTFVDLFMEKFPVIGLLPILADSNSTELVVDLFTCILARERCTQIGFTDAGGFAMIGHILKVGFEGRIRYSIFRRFVRLLDALTHEPAKEQALFHVILNLSIWIHLDGTEHVLYLRDVLYLLVPRYHRAIAQNCDPLSIVAMIRIYYYYQPFEASFVYLDRPKELNLPECRSIMYAIAQILSYEKFDPRLLDMMVAGIIIYPDVHQVSDQLKFLRTIARDSRIQKGDSMRVVLALEKLFECRDALIIAEVFGLLVDLHRSNSIPGLTLEEHFAFISQQSFPLNCFHTDAGLRMITDLAKTVGSDAIPLVTMIAATADDAFRSAVAAVLTPMDPREHRLPLFVWPVVCLYQSQDSIRSQYIAFFSACAPCHWSGISALISVIGTVLNVDGEALNHDFLAQIAKCLKSERDAEIFAKIAVFHSLYRIRSSTFSILNRSANLPPPPAVALQSAKDLLFRIDAMPPSSFDLHFGLRFGFADAPIEFCRFWSEDFEFSRIWLDRDIAETALKISVGRSDLDDGILLLASFMRQFDQNLGEKLFQGRPIKPALAAVYDHRPSELASRFLDEMNNRTDLFPQWTPSECVRILRKFANLVASHYRPIAAQASTAFNSVSTSAMLDFQKKTAKEAKARLRQHSSFLRSISLSEGPWKVSLPRMQRDAVLCGRLCPLRMKPIADSHFPPKFVNRANLPRQWEKPAELVKLHVVEKVTVRVSASELAIQHGKSLKRIPASDIMDVFLRARQQHRSAIEVFCRSGRSCLLHFPGCDALQILDSWVKGSMLSSARIQRATPQSYFEATGLTSLWRDRRISNFEYLLSLNLYSGRSFRDIEQYPVMPWIVKEYGCTVMRTTDPDFFRNLEAPMGHLRAQAVVDYLAGIEPFASMSPEAPITSIEGAFQNGTTELTPEFFMSPEFLRDVVLPSWAKSPIDFVYLHRKALESEIVSSRLNSWRDFVWKGKLFGRAHPRRNEPKKKVITECVKRRLQFTGKIWGVSFHGGKVFCWDSSETLEVCDNVSFHGPKVVELFRARPLEVSPVLTAVCDRIMICFFREAGEVKVYSAHAPIKLPHRGIATAIHSDGNLIAVAGQDSVISVFQILQFDSVQEAFAISTFREKIKTLYISGRFHTIVCGSVDNSISLWSINSRRFTKAVDLGKCRPKKVVITPGWGFIVVFSKEISVDAVLPALTVLTLNGEFIGQTHLLCPIRHWTAWSSRNGFDFLLMSDCNNCVYVFEAYFAVVGEPVAKFSLEIVGLHFDIDEEKILVVLESGDIHVVRYAVNDSRLCSSQTKT